MTAGAVSIDPAVDHETIAEIEPLVPQVVSTYFAEHNFDVVRNPKVHIQIDDGRHYVATLREKFDALTSDPLDPWVKGAAMLYTREFFEDVKAHLNPGGVVTLFVQLYESNTDAVKSEIGTFFEAFPNGMVFGNTNNGVGYDLVLFGQVEPTKIDLDVIEARLKQPGIREGGAVAARDRVQFGRRSVLHLRRQRVGSEAVAEERAHQPRSQPAPAVPGGARSEPVPERADLLRDAQVPDAASESLRRIRRA